MIECAGYAHLIEWNAHAKLFWWCFCIRIRTQEPNSRAPLIIALVFPSSIGTSAVRNLLGTTSSSKSDSTTTRSIVRIAKLHSLTLSHSCSFLSIDLTKRNPKLTLSFEEIYTVTISHPSTPRSFSSSSLYSNISI